MTESADTIIDNNLVSNVQWTGSYDGRSEAFNIRYESGFKALGATGLTLTNNYAAASERVGFNVPGEECSSGVNAYSNNHAVGNLMGVAIFPNDDISSGSGTTCTRLAEFTVFKNRDYGLYYNNDNSVEILNNVYSDNTAAMFTMVIKPNPLDHQCSSKTIKMYDSVVIGKATESDCSSERTASGTYINLSGHCRGLTGPAGSNLGTLFGQFTAGMNNAPEKPCGGIMAYNTICGKTTMESKSAF